jgi:hypothetical protein
MANSDFDAKSRDAQIENESPHRPAETLRRTEAPELVKAMSREDRVKFEKHLVRKIDLRLLPAVVSKYSTA